MPEAEQASLGQLLGFIKESRGFDFTGYKSSSIERRVAKRMAEVGVDGYDQYIEYLELHAPEFAQLFNTILINVTRFFRDPAAWEYLAAEALPALIATRPENSPLRVWCAGVASGEEAYTVAMVLAQLLGENAYRERVRIYATDIDEAALDIARQAAYTPNQIEDVPPELLERFFERTDQRYVFRPELRRCVIFGRNDLVQDAPISHLDLLVCRNTLMYFTSETQSKILRSLHFALDEGGILLLGRSEMLITHGDLFAPVDLKLRVFRKIHRPGLRERIRTIAHEPSEGPAGGVIDDLREAAFNLRRDAQLVLDAAGILVLANDAARRRFNLSERDIGRPLKDLEISYRPLELRSRLDALALERRMIEVEGLRELTGDRERVLNVRLNPVFGRDDQLLGSSITYLDVTETHALTGELLSSRRELEQAYDALQSTNEELETTNEELQSTNEELETMNEELQSSNEELETMNDELRSRTDELHDVNAFLETILTAMGRAVIVLDRAQHVQIWSGQARELWGLTADEVEGRPLLELDIGLPLADLEQQLLALLAGTSEQEQLTVDATNRRGRRFRCGVTLLPLRGYGDGTVTGAIVMMEPIEAGA